MDMTGFRVHQAPIGAEMEGKLSLDWRGCLNREGKSEILADYTRKSIREVLPLGRSKEVEGREKVGDVGNVSRSSSGK